MQKELDAEQKALIAHLNVDHDECLVKAVLKATGKELEENEDEMMKAIQGLFSTSQSSHVVRVPQRVLYLNYKTSPVTL